MPAPFPYQTISTTRSGVTVYRNTETGRYAVTDADDCGFYWTEDEADAVSFAAEVDARFWQDHRALGWQLAIISACGVIAGLALAFTA